MPLTPTQEGLLIDVLDGLDGAQVRQLFTDFHGCKLLTEGFAKHLVDEGVATEEELGLPCDDDDEDENKED